MGSRSLAGRLSIVTGAARGKSEIGSDPFVHQINLKHPGIGSAIAENLASKGSSIILGYRSASSDELARSLCQKLETEYAVKAIRARADVGTKAGCETIINLAKSHFADDMSGALQVDILVNNAGIAKLKGIGDITPEEFMEVYNTNVLGPIHMVQACLPHLPWDGSGRIVNVSSVGSSLGLPEQTLYAGSKGALEAMTRVWARELSKRATVNAINPGPVVSDIYHGIPESVREDLGKWNRITPLAQNFTTQEQAEQPWIRYGGRPAYPAEVAGVVAMLCSQDAGWTTGSLISANGGMRMSV